MPKPSTPNFDEIDPRTCINGKLRKLHRMLNATYQQMMRPYGLRGSMLSILFLIGKRPGIHQRAVAERLVLDESTMSRDLKKLQERGLLLAEKSAKDSRQKEVQLTAAGYELVEDITPKWTILHHRMESALGTFSLQQIDQISHILREELKE